MVGRRRRERYIDRWLREHPRLCIYLSRDDYSRIMSAARASGKSVKDLFIEFVNNMADVLKNVADAVWKRDSKYIHEQGYLEGFDDALDLFINDTGEFIRELIEERGFDYGEVRDAVHRAYMLINSMEG